MIVFTSICANYTAKAYTLCESVKKNIPGSKFIVCLVERNIPDFMNKKDYPLFDDIILAKDIWEKDFPKFIFKHSVVEASTAVKPNFFKFLLKKYKDEDKFIYYDPDIILVSEQRELLELLNKKEIILTPHLTIPEEKGNFYATIDAVMDNELCALQHGCYNLGFLAIKRGKESQALIDWWSSRLEMFCYDDIPRGIFTDQRWMDLSPCFFDTGILKHPGYNTAPWNLSMRKVSLKEEKYYSNDKPLRFFHFSGFDSGANIGMINKYVPDKSNPIYKLRDNYNNTLVKYGQDKHGKTEWSYKRFMNGEVIAISSRIAYRDNYNLQESFPDPFTVDNNRIKWFKLDKIYEKLKQSSRSHIKKARDILKIN